MISANRVALEADLERLVAEINLGSWDAANDMAEYDASRLSEYLGREGAVFVACHEGAGDDRRLLGVASARIEVKPYGGETWLYVDEIDVCSDRRRKGAGAAMMRELFEVALASGCTEVWLGTEADNAAANALYGSLAPDERAEFIGYGWKLSG